MNVKMRGHARNFLSVIIGAVLFALHLPYTVNAEDRKLNAAPELATLSKPSHWREEDQIYRDYFGPLDTRILREYRDRWDYHEQQMAFAGPSYNNEHVSIGSLEPSPFEGDVRRDFAHQVLRMRIDSAVKRYFAEPNRAPSLQRAHAGFRRVTEKLNNYPLKLSAESKDEFRMGYDVASDNSRLEYLTGSVTAGVYHPRLMTALLGSDSLTNLQMRVSAKPGIGLPEVSLGYQWNAADFEWGIRKTLSRDVSTQVVSTYSTRDLSPQTYAWRLEYRF